jgi:DNA-binding NtrC family response regulator
LLGDALHDQGYRFTLVGSGAEMRRALDEDDYDVVIVDVAMRDGEDGLVLADEAAEQGCGVILTTGDRRDFERVERSGHKHIFKPFMIGSLLNLVDDALRDVRARCARRRRRDGSLFPLRTI